MCVCSAWSLWDKMKYLCQVRKWYCFHCFLMGSPNKGDIFWRIHVRKGVCVNKCFLFCHQHHQEWPFLCTEQIFHCSQKTPWLVSGEWLGWRGNGCWRDVTVKRWQSRTAAPGEHRGWGRKRRAPSVAALKWEGGLRWTNFRCEEQKGRFPGPLLYLFLCREDGEVSGYNPAELPSTAYIY